MRKHGIVFRRQVALPIVYKGMQLDCSYRMDFVVEEYLVLEIKAVDHLLAIHEAQLLTYLKLSSGRIGLLINFNVPLLRDGIKRMVR
jgi:GxxExxY protein